jgi:uncharacterized membrane protein YeaQ/YmgE (transglycosylase-associated protein family)
MSLLELLVLLAVAGLCGALGLALGGGRGGCLLSVAVGFVGALLGAWLARSLGLPEIFVVSVGGTAFPVVWAIIGGALFVGVLTLLTRGRRAP